MIVLANVMIPSLAEHLVVMFVLLVPIALIEAIVLTRRHLLKYNDCRTIDFRLLDCRSRSLESESQR
ncbi:MAG: hypothetical protein V1809_02885 [Planctomycetota bacterium]